MKKNDLDNYKNIPPIEVRWDTSEKSISYNDVCYERVIIYTCSLTDFWNGVHEPDEVFGVHKLWSEIHNRDKISQVIEDWENKIPLSPIYITKHGGDRDISVIVDGNHRLSVAVAAKADSIAFMVISKDEIWIKNAFPNATRVCEYPDLKKSSITDQH